MAARKPTQLAERILTRVRERGSDARDLRDAAHEASHGLEIGLRVWNREALHKALVARPFVDQFRSELFARAVEANICALCEEPYEQGYYILIAHMEALKNGLRLPNNFKDMVETARRDTRVGELVRRIRTLRPLRSKS